MQQPWFRETELFTCGSGRVPHVPHSCADRDRRSGTVLALCEGRIVRPVRSRKDRYRNEAESRRRNDVGRYAGRPLRR